MGSRFTLETNIDVLWKTLGPNKNIQVNYLIVSIFSHDIIGKSIRLIIFAV